MITTNTLESLSNDLAVASKNPKGIIQTLKDDYGFKIKGDGQLEYHLGMEFIRDKDGTLGQGSKRYIDKILESYKKKFGNLPKKARSPLDPKDHPEIDDTDLLDETDTKHYMSMMGELQWVVTIGRFDVHAAVMTMSLFCIAPKKVI